MVPLALLLLWCGSVFAAAAEIPAGFDKIMQPFLSEHCLRCHGEKKQKGDLRLDSLAREFTEMQTAERWAEVVFRMNSGEMPPEDEKQPSAEELGRVVDWLSRRGQTLVFVPIQNW